MATDRSPSDSVGAYEAKTHFSELLARVAEGEELVITRHGAPIARLVPVHKKATSHERYAAIARINELRKRLSLGKLTVKQLRAEGRR